MLAIDASALLDVLVRTERGEAVRQRMRQDQDVAAPHVIDAEVLGTIRGHHLRGSLHRTAATQTVEDLRAWPGQRFGHQAILGPAWELRAVRGLAEALQAPLVISDTLLARVQGPQCTVEVIASG
jgi:predicted nucleic acid-binding protein